MRDESQADYLTRYWEFRLDLQKPRHIFIAKVIENDGWYDAMSRRGGRWHIRVQNVSVLTGAFPDSQFVNNSNSCGANLSIGSTVIILADEDYFVGRCSVEQHHADQESALNKALTSYFSRSPWAAAERGR